MTQHNQIEIRPFPNMHKMPIFVTQTTDGNIDLFAKCCSLKEVLGMLPGASAEYIKKSLTDDKKHHSSYIEEDKVKLDIYKDVEDRHTYKVVKIRKIMIEKTRKG